jgi:hypothetical protein
MTDDCLPELTDDQFTALLEDIRLRGVQAAVEVCAKTGEVLDGRARVRACVELKVRHYPRRVVSGLETDEDRRHHRLRANCIRRQLDRLAVKRLVLAEMTMKGQSDRMLAGIFGVSHTCIANRRRDFVSGGNKLPGETREGRDGKTYPARRPTAMFATTSASASKASKLLNDLGDHAPGRTLSSLTAGILATKVRREEVDHQTIPLKLPPRVKLHEGRFQDVGKKIKDGSVDCIFTDPPYSKEWVEQDQWADLAVFASRVLKPGGLLITYSGVAYLVRVMAALGSTGLTYLWTIASLSLSQKNRNYHRRVLNSWKPILIFGQGTERLPESISDVIEGTGIDKRHHEFEQSEAEAEYLLARLVPKGGVVLDCCMGSGTTLVVARRLKLTAIGIDCDPTALALTRARLGCREPAAAEAIG